MRRALSDDVDLKAAFRGHSKLVFSRQSKDMRAGLPLSPECVSSLTRNPLRSDCGCSHGSYRHLLAQRWDFLNLLGFLPSGVRAEPPSPSGAWAKGC